MGTKKALRRLPSSKRARFWPFQKRGSWKSLGNSPRKACWRWIRPSSWATIFP